MPRAGFYNDNEYRQYPFIPANPDALPTELIVDCGFIMGLDSGFDSATHCVYLHQVRRTDPQIEIEFRTTAPAASTTAIVFSRDFTAAEWTTEFVEAPSAEKDCASEPLWEGFLVTGLLTSLVQSLPPGGNLTFVTTNPFIPNRVVEHARVQSLVKTYLRSVSLGNYPRTVIPPCVDGVPGAANPGTEIVINAECLQGNIRFKPGFNCSVAQSDYDSRIIISAEKGANTSGAGAAEFCQFGSEIKLYAAELPPIINADTGARSKFLSGGPACDEIITGINGLGAPDVKIVGGAGVQIVTNPATHTIQLKIAENLLTENC